MNRREFRRTVLQPADERYTVFRIPRLPSEICAPCFYCGEPAGELDHAPPLSRVDAYVAFDLAEERYIKVWSCRECNSLLGDSLQIDLLARERELKLRLRRKYRHHLGLAEWTEEELSEMSRPFLRMLRGSTKVRLTIEQRLDFCRGVDAYLQWECEREHGMAG
jgi:hypothetical protein